MMLRILIADEQEIVRRGMRRLFEAQPGWLVVSEVSAGDRAVEEAERHRPDVAILDAFMPGLDGISAARAIRTQARETEVLIFTMHESDELVAEVLASGARGYVLKADPTRYLIAAVDALSHHNSFVTPSIADATVRSVGLGARARRRPGSHSALTNREREVVRRLALGASNREVALQMGISVKTVESHRANVMRKLEIGSIVELVRYAVRNELVRP